MKNECSLCGGRIEKGKCIQCGMDFFRREKSSQPDVNRKSAAVKPVAVKPVAVKPVAVKPAAPGSAPQPQSTITRPKLDEAKGNGSKYIIAVVIISALLTMAGTVYEYIADQFSSGTATTVAPGDESLSEHNKRELPLAGEFYQVDLEAGSYIVGEHIPAGQYTVTMEERWGWLQVDDPDNAIYFSQGVAAQGEEDDFFSGKVEDLWLYNGARLAVQSSVPLHFEAANAQLDSLAEAQPNPLDQEVVIDRELVAGVDFEPGTYDIELDTDYLELEIRDRDGNELMNLTLEDNDYGFRKYLNVTLGTGDSIIIVDAPDEEHLARMIPSPAIY